MYVIVDSEMPDHCVETLEELHLKLTESPWSFGYEYKTQPDGTWKVGKKWMIIENDELVFYPENAWKCPEEYKTYKFPNKCEICDHSQFIQGKSCQYCDYICTDCGNMNCKCDIAKY